VKCVLGGLEGSGAKRASRNGEGLGGFAGSTAGIAFERSLRFVRSIASFGGVSSLDVYPAHFRPKFEQRKQFGLVSSHFTRRALLDQKISKYNIQTDQTVRVQGRAAVYPIRGRSFLGNVLKGRHRGNVETDQELERISSYPLSNRMRSLLATVASRLNLWFGGSRFLVVI
jgi:hypothetical protein